MKLSDETLQVLVNIIYNISCRAHVYNSSEEIVDRVMTFFSSPLELTGLKVFSPKISLNDYIFGVLSEHNKTDIMKKIIEELLNPYRKSAAEPNIGNKNQIAGAIQDCFDEDGYGYELIAKREENYGYIFLRYHILDKNEFAETPVIEENNQVQDIITKAKERFTREDYEGAISSSFNLAETVIKKLLDDLNIPYKRTAQFIDLYPILSNELNLNPAGENIEGRLKPILQGLKSQAEGLYHLANKASDRHTPEHPPKRQDAKLAMNAAFTLCEYLSDTHKSRQTQ